MNRPAQVEDAIDEIDALTTKAGAVTTIGIYVVSARRALDGLKSFPECDRVRLAADLLQQSLNVVEAELKAARVALLEEVQS